MLRLFHNIKWSHSFFFNLIYFLFFVLKIDIILANWSYRGFDEMYRSCFHQQCCYSAFTESASRFIILKSSAAFRLHSNEK
jgi:hypothetical protein